MTQGDGHEIRISRPPVCAGRTAWEPERRGHLMERSVEGLRVQDCTKSYRAVKALDQVSFDVAPGSIVGLIGANGAGKTTLMHALMGLIRLTGGTMTVDGRSAWTRDGKRCMAFMPDELPRPTVLTGTELLRFNCHLYRRKPEGIPDLAERLEMGGVLDRPLAGYSHGMRRKIDLMAALILKPRVLVLDEPFSGMDPIAVEAMSDILNEFRTHGGVVLLSSHDLELVNSLVDRIVLLDFGRVVFAGAVEELMNIHGTTDMRRAFVAHIGSDGT